jgi:hypothetical protein
MRGVGEIRGRRLRLVLLAALAALLALGVVSPAVAKKKHKKKKVIPAVTIAAQAPFASSSTGTANAGCSGGTHVAGGGWTVSPHFDPGTNTGLRSVNSSSTFIGTTGWTATSEAFAGPAASGSFTTLARCENNKLGRIATSVSGSATIPSAELRDLVITCPTGTHVLTGGYSASGLAAFSNSLNNLRILILQSRRTAANQWTVSAFENNLVPASGNTSVSALCEYNAKGRTISESSTSSGFGNLSRASGDPSCLPKTHVVGGGYSLAPTNGDLPVAGVDEFNPNGNTGWHLGLHSIGGQPAGATVTTYAYCAPDAVKKKKKKKK